MNCCSAEEKKKSSYANADWALRMNRLILNELGIWPAVDDAVTTFRELRIPFMVLWLLIFMDIPAFYALFKVWPRFSLVIDNLSTNCAGTLSTIKVFFLWFNRRVLARIIKTILRDWSAPRTPPELAIMAKQARRGRIFTITGLIIMAACAVGFTMTPVFSLRVRLVNNITDLTDGHYFPLQTFYPWNFTGSPSFELIYASQMLAICFAGASFSVSDNLFGVLVFHVSGQCEILGEDLKRLFAGKDVQEGVGDLGTERQEKVFRWRLVRAVRRHVQLTRLASDIEKSFNLMILAHAICLTIIVCCMGYGILRSIDSERESTSIVRELVLVGTLLNLFIHMLVYCIASEILANHSAGLSFAIYSTKWYLLSRSCCRDVAFVMKRAKHPFRLTAGKFFELSLATYLKFLKTSAGYISMLLAVGN